MRIVSVLAKHKLYPDGVRAPVYIQGARARGLHEVLSDWRREMSRQGGAGHCTSPLADMQMILPKLSGEDVSL